MSKEDKTEFQALSASNVLDLLEHFQGKMDELGVAELSYQLNLHSNSVLKLLATLESRGYVKQNKVTGKYRLGLKTLELGKTFVQQMCQPYQSEPMPEVHAKRCNETSCDAVPQEFNFNYSNSVETDFVSTARVVPRHTGRNMTQDQIHGLDSSADNYLVKPEYIDEHAAAIKCVECRIARTAATTSWNLNVEASCLHSPNGISIQLTAKECLLMKLMFKHLGKNVSRTDIFQAIGEPPDDAYSNPRLEVLISRLRSKILKHDPGSPLPLRARHNIGYIFLAKEK
jgi:predicted transcriptional regulator